MSNKIKITISTVCVILLILIFLVLYFTIFNMPKVELEVSVNSITLEVDESIDLKDIYTISSGKNSSVICLVDDAIYATVNGDNILVGKNIGVTTLYIKTSNGRNGYIEKDITINIIAKSILPSSFSFEKKEVTLGIDTEFSINKIICNESYNVVPTITYSNPNICSYGYLTGKISPLNIGSTTITVTFEKNNDKIFKSFVVHIQEKYRKIELNLTKENNNNYVLLMEKDEFTMFTIKVYEGNNLVNTNTEVEILSNDCGFSVVQKEYGNVSCIATSNGEATIKIYCTDDESVFEIIKVRVN